MSRAVYNGKIKVMEVLLAAGADREAKDNVSRKMCVQVTVEGRSREGGRGGLCVVVVGVSLL